jgi:hypothetical protein
MQSKQQSSGSETPVKHPSEIEWMEFMYEEVSPSRKQELREHLSRCASCAEQVRAWRGGMAALDTFRLPAANAPALRWQPVLRWASAAAVILVMGFVLGRVTSGSDRQLRELQASLSELRQVVHANPAVSAEEVVSMAGLAAGEETLRILSEYAQTLESQRVQDRQAVGLVIRSLENRVNTLRTELETVAVNTQDGLQATHQNLAHLAYYAINPERPAHTTLNQDNLDTP